MLPTKFQLIWRFQRRKIKMWKVNGRRTPSLQKILQTPLHVLQHAYKNMVIFTNDNLPNRLSSLNIILMQFVCIFGFNWLRSTIDDPSMVLMNK
jgi:hypothetical protein